MLDQPIPKPARLPLTFVPPMKPILVDEVPLGDDWIHEIKYDGYRTQIIIGDDIRAYTKNGHDWTEKYAPIVSAVRALDARNTILDGELVVQDENGRSDFHTLRSAITSHPDRLIFYAFDMMAVDGIDIRSEPVIDRRQRLQNLIGEHGLAFPIQFSDHFTGNGPLVFAHIDEMGLEGIVSKKTSSRYRSGPASAWVKTKTFVEDEFVIVGTERGVGPTTALMARETSEGLEYVGGAMLTVSAAERERFWTAVEQLARRVPPLKTEKRKGAAWVEPQLRARVKHLRGEEKLRHATVKQILW